jgi:phosphatidylethanolamine-binding protein (PEBP) family uncharacterized protein
MLARLPEFLGQALQRQRAGMNRTLFHRCGGGYAFDPLDFSSPAFGDYGALPTRFTADGNAVSPPLQWRHVPEAATTLALIVEAADSPTPEPLVHAIAVDIDPGRGGVLEGELKESVPHAFDLNLGRNSYWQRGWLPPDPPPGHGIHRYAFQLFALAHGRPFSAGPGRSELVDAIHDRAVACGCFVGTYERERL